MKRTRFSVRTVENKTRELGEPRSVFTIHAWDHHRVPDGSESDRIISNAVAALEAENARAEAILSKIDGGMVMVYGVGVLSRENTLSLVVAAYWLGREEGVKEGRGRAAMEAL